LVDVGTHFDFKFHDDYFVGFYLQVLVEKMGLPEGKNGLSVDPSETLGKQWLSFKIFYCFDVCFINICCSINSQKPMLSTL
jgi:hypothetical protein